jgi:Cu(I)/Ag(I) efflux system membrane fusion protein
MNRTFLIPLLIGAVSLAALGGWQLGRKHSVQATPEASGERKVLFYQSPMHPWIKSDKPGNCTICGMKLVPVFEGEQPAASGGDDAAVVRLSPQSINVLDVETTPVVRQPLARTIRVAGMIDDDDSRHRRLSAYVEGRIDKLFVNYVGAEVIAGQPLASLYSRDLLVARSELGQALRQSPSNERETFLAASRQKLRRLGLTPEQIEKLPGQTGDTVDIVAPISGTVIERKVYEGQYVKEGDVLFEIADFSKMWFVFDAYERDLAWIRVGQPVEITTPSVPGKTFTAPIAFIDPNLVMNTRSAKVRVVLDNPNVSDPTKHRHELLHKIYADGRIRVETDPVLTIPRGAVLSTGAEPLVYVAKDERHFEPRRVTLGRAGDDLWEVVAGLKEGERVVTTGNLLIDAQAQLDHPPQTLHLGGTGTEMTEVQRTAARELLASAAALSEALASDDLAAHSKLTEAFRAKAEAVSASFGESARRLREVVIPGPAADLLSARKQFYPVGVAVAELARQWRQRDPAFAEVKVFECPMAKSVVPSAETNQGRWVQVAGPLRNPFFGSEMIDCGKEIKP